MTKEEFKEKRLSMGFTQEKMADFLGVTKRQIAYFENGKSEIKKLYIDKISSFDEKREKINLSDDEKKLIQDYQELTKEEKNFFAAQIQLKIAERKMEEAKKAN